MEPSSRRTLTREDYERYMPALRRMAMRFARHLPSTIAVSDVVGSGLIGLVNGLSEVDPAATPEAAQDYLLYRARSAMLDYVGSFDAQTQEVMENSRRLTRVIRDQYRARRRPPYEDEIASALGINLTEYGLMLRTLGDAGMVRLEVGDFDNEGFAERSPADVATRLASAIDALPVKLQQLLALKYQEGCSSREIGAVLDLTESRVIELHVEAVHRLRAGIAEELP